MGRRRAGVDEGSRRCYVQSITGPFVADLVKASALGRLDGKLFGIDLSLLGIGVEAKPLAKKGKKLSPIVKVLGFNLEHEDPPSSRPHADSTGVAPSYDPAASAKCGEEEQKKGRTFGPVNVFPRDVGSTFLVGPVPCYVAANAGLGASRGEFLVLLNNDTVVTRRWATALLRHLVRDPRLGLVGPVTNAVLARNLVQLAEQAG